jgi:hypothetical protein
MSTKSKPAANSSVPVGNNSNNNNMAPTPPSVKWKAHFTPPQNLTFQWKPPTTTTDKFINTTKDNYICADMIFLKGALKVVSMALGMLFCSWCTLGILAWHPRHHQSNELV